MQRCYEGKRGLSIIRDTYTNFSCLQKDPRKAGKGVVFHIPEMCHDVDRGMQGQSQRARCDKMPPAMATRDMVVLQSFLRSDCGGGVTSSGANPEVLGIFLNTCALSAFPAKGEAAQHYRKLTYVSGDGLSSDLLLLETRYKKTDKRCTGAAVGQGPIVLPSVDGTGACLPNPLHPGRFYMNVMRTLDYSSSSAARGWTRQPVWAQPTSKPSPPPTPTPT